MAKNNNLATKLRKNFTSSVVAFGALRVSKMVDVAGVDLIGHTPHSDKIERSEVSIILETCSTRTNEIESHANIVDDLSLVYLDLAIFPSRVVLELFVIDLI